NSFSNINKLIEHYDVRCFRNDKERYITFSDRRTARHRRADVATVPRRATDPVRLRRKSLRHPAPFAPRWRLDACGFRLLDWPVWDKDGGSTGRSGAMQLRWTQRPDAWLGS